MSEKANRCVACEEELSSVKPSVESIQKDRKTRSYSINGIKAILRIRVEQDVDLVLKKIELKMFCQAHDKVLLTLDKRFKHYKANEERINLKD